ncbi:hypothetical protein U1Q18_015764, partial [Sarracenia purpurea var. burkii]
LQSGCEPDLCKQSMVFFNDGVYGFDLEDLLRASAEVLGKGSVGTSYKAVLEEGTTVVVKRLKDVVVTKKEFEMQMEVLGRIKHDNVVPKTQPRSLQSGFHSRSCFHSKSGIYIFIDFLE